MLLHCFELEIDEHLENNDFCDEFLFTGSLRGNSVILEMRETLAGEVPNVMSPVVWVTLSGPVFSVFTCVGPGC